MAPHSSSCIATARSNRRSVAINIGIIDPGYEGLVSSTLINFCKSPKSLRTGDIFLRLTFHDFDPLKNPPDRKVVPDSAYIADKRSKVERHFSETFLNLEETVAELTRPVAESVFESWRRVLSFYIPIGALVLSLLAFFVTLGASYYSRSFRQQFLLVVARRTETVLTRFTDLRPTDFAAASLAFTWPFPFWRRYVGARRRIVMLRLMPSVAYRHLFESASAYWRFFLGWQAHRGFLSWVVFALFNGILICRGLAFAGSILELTSHRVRAYS